ncbi:MAG: phytoene desaturase family protein [Ectothiorhodospiraceae bacterium]
MTTNGAAPPASTPRSGRHDGNAIVVGGGFGGIATALRLRARGLRVTLVERLERLGGRAQVYERDGFRFDAGPTVITAPWLFDELFALFGRERAAAVPFLPVTPWYRIGFADGSHLDYGPDRERTEAEIQRLAPDDLSGYRAFAAHTRAFHDVAFTKLGAQPFHRLGTLARHGPRLLWLQAFRSVYGMASRYMRDERLRQAFSLQPLLIGGNPKATTSIYSLIHELEHRGGVVFPRGGTGALVDALDRLLRDVGVEVITGQTVERIDTNAGRVTGVSLASGESLPASVVVSDADPAFVHRHMLPGVRRRQWTNRRLNTLRYAMGLYVLYFATDCRYPEVAHHTIQIGADYHNELDGIFRRGELTSTPSLYLHRPTATDPEMAPPGQDTFYVLAAVPNLNAGIDWSQAAPRLRETVIDQLQETLLPDLRAHLVTAFDVTPEDFGHDYLASYGSAFSIQPLFTQSAWFRFHNRSNEVRGLYFAGAGTHPGAGVPGVVTSAKVVESVLADEGVFP